MFELPRAMPLPANEPILGYAPGSAERATLKARLAVMAAERIELPHWVGSWRMPAGDRFDVRMPHAHTHVLGTASNGGRPIAEQAIAAAREAAHDWSRTPFETRARIFLRAAELAAGPYRAILNAATMLGQSKTAYQAEIDAACELIDFLRFNVSFASNLLEQPVSAPGVRNVVEARPLEGFVLAVTPFNFTAIAGNLPSAPALLGNVVVWKPSESQALAAHYTMQMFLEAGLPPGVINLVHGDGASISETCLDAADFAGLHFTGSTEIFRALQRRIGEKLAFYKNFPRVVGETGGKDFVLAHASAEPESLAVALVRGAFEFQGQKCSAASRAYVPRSLWPQVKTRLLDEIRSVRLGDVRDFRTFMGAVIHERSYDKLHGWKTRLEADPSCSVHGGDRWSKAEGYFAGPTVVEVSDPKHELLQTELFGPILGIHVYDDAKFGEICGLVDETSPYALTGALFATDRAALQQAADRLRHAAGNLYVNDKPTGAVVAQQPFGGGRASGTNDKAGSVLNLLRWISPRVIKETFCPPTSVPYPSMAEE